MATTSTAPVPLVHLVGSVPLATSSDVFTKLSSNLPNRLRRIPDGETAERGIFTLWQVGVFPREITHRRFFKDDYQAPENFELTLDHIKPTQYDTVALASYAQFRALRDEGKLPAGLRFQVSLPTPINSVDTAVSEKYAAQALDFYETRLLNDLANLQANIPADDLAIQWDLAVEMAHMEYAYGKQQDKLEFIRPSYDNVKETIAARVARLAAGVHAGVEMGFHFCYGDFEHKHFVEPDNAALLVDLINLVVAGAERSHPVHWVHLPVPKARTDESYFEPLKKLHVGQALPFLGLVHAGDEEGTRSRIETARKVLPGMKFAVSTECGLGRTPPAELDSIFEICRNVTANA